MRIFGHPVHPAIVHFPIAGWILTPLADLVYYVGGDPFWSRGAALANAAALAFAAPAIIAGTVDLRRLKDRPAAAGAAMLHVSLMTFALMASIASLYLRLPFSAPAWSLSAAGLSLAAAAATAVGGYFGGAMVYVHGLGLRRGPTEAGGD